MQVLSMSPPADGRQSYSLDKLESIVKPVTNYSLSCNFAPIFLYE
jgi:hypothetical protein